MMLPFRRLSLFLILAARLARGQQAPIYINCGATAPYDDADGRNWIPDPPFISTGNSYVTKSAIEGTENDPIYQSERYFTANQPIEFAIPVAAAGDYSVTLHFAEIYFTDAGSRSFDVYLQGKMIAEDLDVVDAAAGPFMAYKLSNITTVSDGYVNITLVKKVEHPKINGIEILEYIPELTVSPQPTPSPVDAKTAGPTTAEPTTTSAPTSETPSTAVPATEAPTTTAPSNTSPTADAPATAVPTAKASKTAAPSADVPVPMTVAPSTAAPSPFAIRINCGGIAYIDDALNEWAEDSGFTGGRTFSDTADEIEGTNDDELFQTERYGEFSYAFNVPSPGIYNVTLYFAELYWTTADARIFKVSVEGEVPPSLSTVDIAQIAGPNAAVYESVLSTVSDGVLNLEFTSITNNAKSRASPWIVRLFHLAQLH